MLTKLAIKSGSRHRGILVASYRVQYYLNLLTNYRVNQTSSNRTVIMLQRQDTINKSSQKQ